MDRHRGSECFDPAELNGAVFTFTVPLGAQTPEEAVLAMYSDMHLSLQKRAVGIARVRMCNAGHNRLQASLSIRQPLSTRQAMELVSKCFRFCHEVEIPLCLYTQRTEITKRIKQIMDETGTVISTKISSRVTAYVCGAEQPGLSARMAILQMIEEMSGRRVLVTDVSMPVREALEQGARIYFRSRINSSEALVSHSSQGFVPRSLPLVVEKLVLDSLKLFYILLYKRCELEDILADTQSSMATEELQHSTEVVLRGFDAYEVRRARDMVSCLYNSVMKMAAKTIDCGSGDFFVFEMGGRNMFLVVGEKDCLLRMVPEGNVFVEAQMDIDAETAEFLCGKKNGKIARIMKDIDCVIAVHRGSEWSRMCLSIGGCSAAFSAAFEMIENEFPEELTFCIDERHHKRIIGYGGKNIQRIMKKHGVYIKFMSEKDRRRVGYRDNVVIKTPRKNVENLVRMKSDVMELIGDAEDPTPRLCSTVSLYDFYVSPQPRYRLLYNRAVVEDREKIHVAYYLGSGNDGRLVEIGGLQFAASTRNLALERVTAAHWLDEVKSMPVFSWLSSCTYSSLFGKDMQDVHLARLL